MELLNYVLLSIVSFLGLLIGILISNMTIEEITHASKYLKYLNLILVPLIVLISTFKINRIYSIIFTSIILITLTITREKYNDAWTYTTMGALLYVATVSQELLQVTTLIFLYGISIATINASTHFKNKINGQIKFGENIQLIKKILAKYSYYLLVGIIFFVVFSYVL
jgi:hypothetical protein